MREFHKTGFRVMTPDSTKSPLSDEQLLAMAVDQLSAKFKSDKRQMQRNGWVLTESPAKEEVEKDQAILGAVRRAMQREQSFEVTDAMCEAYLLAEGGAEYVAQIKECDPEKTILEDVRKGLTAAFMVLQAPKQAEGLKIKEDVFIQTAASEQSMECEPENIGCGIVRCKAHCGMMLDDGTCYKIDERTESSGNADYNPESEAWHTYPDGAENGFQRRFAFLRGAWYAESNLQALSDRMVNCDLAAMAATINRIKATIDKSEATLEERNGAAIERLQRIGESLSDEANRKFMRDVAFKVEHLLKSDIEWQRQNNELRAKLDAIRKVVK